jgi:hypothetical protein
MKASRTSETLVSNHHIARRNNPEKYEFYFHCSVNLKFRIRMFVFPVIEQIQLIKPYSGSEKVNVKGKVVPVLNQVPCHEDACLS